MRGSSVLCRSLKPAWGNKVAVEEAAAAASLLLETVAEVAVGVAVDLEHFKCSPVTETLPLGLKKPVMIIQTHYFNIYDLNYFGHFRYFAYI